MRAAVIVTVATTRIAVARIFVAVARVVAQRGSSNIGTFPVSWVGEARARRNTFGDGGVDPDRERLRKR